ncbi:MAG: CDP-alcohol phosphatidyltransferase family protein, partial [Vicinamibacterales bacterium]
MAPLGRSIALAAGCGLLAVAVLARLIGPSLQAGAMYGLRSMAVFTAMMLAAGATIGGRHPFLRFGPANQVTTIRAMLVALVAGAVVEPVTSGTAWWVIGAAALMAALDGIDGWLARRTGMASPFGAWFDVETDALLILILSVFVWRYEKAGAWVVACGLMRYAFVAGGWILPWLAGPLPPTLRGKTVAVATLAGLSVALAPTVPAPISRVMAAMTLLALAGSFAVDVGRLRHGEG